ncbi:hypothetical protein H6G90_36975, partial [Nostoc sp. FACHB-145]|nr:hypothetical protein [Nostoc sp. FACHB-145]
IRFIAWVFSINQSKLSKFYLIFLYYFTIVTLGEPSKLLHQYGSLKLSELYFATGIQLVGACLWLGALTCNEQLFCSFTHVVPLISAKTAEFLANDVMATLERACKTDDLRLSLAN